MSQMLMAKQPESSNNGGSVTLDKSQELERLMEALRVLESHMNKVKERDEVKEMHLAAQHAESLVPDFKRQLADIYRHPEKVFDYFAGLCMAEGVAEAAARMQEKPEKISSLKGWAVGPLQGSARSAIIKLSLPMALKTGSSGFSSHITAGGGSFGRDDLKARVQSLKTRLENLNTVAGASGDRIELELKVAEAARKTPQQELQKLSREHRKLVEDLIYKCKPLLIDANEDPYAAKRAADKKLAAGQQAKPAQNPPAKAAEPSQPQEAAPAESPQEPETGADVSPADNDSTTDAFDIVDLGSAPASVEPEELSSETEIKDPSLDNDDKLESVTAIRSDSIEPIN